MSSNKVKTGFKTILRNLLIPLTFLIASFAPLLSCYLDPINNATLSELVANDVQHVETVSGLVQLKFDKVKEDYNFIYSSRYYFERIAEHNKGGKEYAILKNNQFVLNNGTEMVDGKIDYALGITDFTSFKKLDLNLNLGNILESDYDIDSKENHCVVSKSFASAYLGGSEFDGRTIEYVGSTFIIDGIVGDENFASSKCEGRNFIALRFARIASKELDFEYNLFLKPSNYFDNYSIFKLVFEYIYRRTNDYYISLTIVNGEWILNDIEYYRANQDLGLKRFEVKPFIIISVSLFTLGLLTSLISVLVIKHPSGEKESFFVFMIGAFFYFGGLWLSKLIFDGMFIKFIHINLFSAYSVLFAFIYFFVALNGALIPCILFGKNKKKTSDEQLVSIIIPVYNGSNYVGDAITSALNQTYKNIEVIVINDGSKDEGKTESVIKSFTDDRVRYIKKKNGGVASALNKGIDAANGKYICWLSHDDLLPSDKIMSQLTFFNREKKTNVIPYSKVVIIDEFGKKRKWKSQIPYKISHSGGKTPSDFFKLQNIIFSSLLVPAQFLKEHKFRKELSYSQDIFAFFDILTNGYVMKYFNKGWTYYRVHSSQGSFQRASQIDSNIIAMFKIFKGYFQETKDYKFMKKYFRHVSIKAARYDVYKTIRESLIENRLEYKISKSYIRRSTFLMKIAKLLYKVKVKLLGR